MNILHVVRTPISVTSFLMPFLKAQIQQGHSVAVACNAREDTSAIEAEGIAVCKYRLERSLNVLNLYRAFRSLKHLITQTQLDLIIVHMPIASAITRLAAKFSPCRARVIYVAHGLPCAPHQSYPRWLFWFTIEWLLGRLTDALFVMNQYDYNLATRTCMLPRTELIRRIPGMGVDLERFSPQEETSCQSFWEQFGIDKQKRIVLFVARLIKEKGVFELLEAARLLKKNNYAFVLLGDGPLYDAISKFIDKHNLSGQVFLLGWRNDVHDFMRHCDVFVLPTYYFEGLPVTILEAMACGKPVIATRHRGCEDAVIEGQNGYLVNVKDTHQLAEKIDIILSNRDLASTMGSAGRLRAKECFSLPEAITRFCEELSKVSLLWKEMRNS